MKVVFTPSLDEQVVFASAHQKRYRPRLTTILSNAFVVLNLVIIPAALLFNDLVRAGIIVFVLNLAFYLVLTWQQRNFLRTYYETVWPTIEEHVCEVNLGEDGVSCHQAGNSSFISWPNVRNVFQNKDLVIIDGGHTQILASKRGFGTEEDTRAFVSEAKERTKKWQR